MQELSSHFRQELTILEESRKDDSPYTPLLREEGGTERWQSRTKLDGGSRGGVSPVQVFFNLVKHFMGYLVLLCC